MSSATAKDLHTDVKAAWLAAQTAATLAREAEEEAHSAVLAAEVAAQWAAVEAEKTRLAAEKAKADVLWARMAMEAERADVAAWCRAVPLNERAVRAAKEGRCWDCFAKTSHTDGELPMCKECFDSWTTMD
jgi:hypothetical protein